MQGRYRALIHLFILVLTAGVLLAAYDEDESESFRIGALLNLTGPNALGMEDGLDWAIRKANDAGGIGGRKIELVYKDTFGQDILTLAQEFIDDASIQIVIGPDTSGQSFDLAPLFIENKKLLISPSASAANLYRAFGGKNFFWRTVQGDVAQSKTILHLLQTEGVRTVSLLYEDNAYGQTFRNWIPFFAMEMGIDITDTIGFESDTKSFSEPLDRALREDPERIIVVSSPTDAVRIVRELESRDSGVRLFFTDYAPTSYLIENLGELAEGLEGTAPSLSPDSGFARAYAEEFGQEPAVFAASAYDAGFIAICTLARNEYTSGEEWIEDSFKKTVFGRGEKVNWDDPGKAVSLLSRGIRPDIEGATGPLEFDVDLGVDPIRTFYAHWKVSGGKFETVEVIPSWDMAGGNLQSGRSIFQTRGSRDLAVLPLLKETAYDPEARQDLQAVIIASSKDWANYRHQADALAIYNLLKDNGVSDDKIILFLIDDLAYGEDNPMQGVIRHNPGGENIYEDVRIDYTGDQVTVENLRNVLLGNSSERTPVVLQSDDKTNVFLYIVDHGHRDGIVFDYGPWLSPEDMTDITDRMYEQKLYRQMLIMTEMCFGEGMGLNLDTPGVLYFTASAMDEQSYGANYDAELGVWLADDFTRQVVTVVSRNPQMYLADLYAEVYGRVSGSHVTLMNYENFGGFQETRIRDFVIP